MIIQQTIFFALNKIKQKSQKLRRKKTNFYEVIQIRREMLSRDEGCLFVNLIENFKNENILIYNNSYRLGEAVSFFLVVVVV